MVELRDRFDIGQRPPAVRQFGSDIAEEARVAVIVEFALALDRVRPRNGAETGGDAGEISRLPMRNP